MNSENGSAFPALIRYSDTGDKVIVKNPNDIVSGRAFRVLETNVKISGKK